MSIRIVVREQDMTHVVHGGAEGPSVKFKTFDLVWPELESYLLGAQHYVTRDVLGVEFPVEK